MAGPGSLFHLPRVFSGVVGAKTVFLVFVLVQKRSPEVQMSNIEILKFQIFKDINSSYNRYLDSNSVKHTLKGRYDSTSVDIIRDPDPDNRT